MDCLHSAESSVYNDNFLKHDCTIPTPQTMYNGWKKKIQKYCYKITTSICGAKALQTYYYYKIEIVA